MSIHVETTGVRLTNLQEARLKQLFEWLIQQVVTPNGRGEMFRGSIEIPFSGGTPGTAKMQSFHDLGGNGNGTKRGPELLLDQSRK